MARIYGIILLTLGTSYGAPAPTNSLTALPEVQQVPFNVVTFLGTHNPVSCKWGVLDVRNQTKCLSDQLKDGVRAFSMRTHDGKFKGTREAFVCHGNMEVRLPGTWGDNTACDVDPGSMRLVDFLTTIRDFLTRYPTEIITLHIADFTHEKQHQGLAPDTLVKAFDDAGVRPLVYEQSNHQAPWPTIAQLIERNKRLIVIHSDNNQHSPYTSWLLPKYEFVIDSLSSHPGVQELLTDYQTYQVDGRTFHSPAYQNRLNPEIHNALLKVNHHITKGLAGNQKMAKQVNTYQHVMKRMREWQKIFEIPPHALILDFYDSPDASQLFKAVKDITLENARAYQKPTTPTT